jgi:ABC-type ATPase involved in cell division
MTVLMVTHEQVLAEKYSGRMLHLADGRLLDDVPNISSAQAPAARGKAQ